MHLLTTELWVLQLEAYISVTVSTFALKYTRVHWVIWILSSPALCCDCRDTTLQSTNMHPQGRNKRATATLWLPRLPVCVSTSKHNPGLGIFILWLCIKGVQLTLCCGFMRVKVLCGGSDFLSSNSAIKKKMGAEYIKQLSEQFNPAHHDHNTTLLPKNIPVIHFLTSSRWAI